MDSIAEFKRKYIKKSDKKNNSASYKMEDWFENMFQQPQPRSKTRKSKSPKRETATVVAVRSKSKSSSKENSPVREIVNAVSLEELVVPPKRESKIVILNPLSPRTRKLRKDVSDAKLAARLLEPKVPITNPNPLRLNMTRRINAGVNIEDTRVPLGRTMHNCGGVIPNCKSISQMKDSGSYSILYNNGTEKVFSTFGHLVTFITDTYMDNNSYTPYAKRAGHENRIRQTLLDNGITARGTKTKKNRGKRTKRRKGRK